VGDVTCDKATSVLRFPQGSGYIARVGEYPKLPPRLRWIFSNNPVFFVTFCTHEREKLLASDAVHAAFVAFASQANSRQNIAVGRYVIMPDHIHLFVRGPDDFQLGPMGTNAETSSRETYFVTREIADLATRLFRSSSAHQ
jgi:REP element-mobilizing transposase RayT